MNHTVTVPVELAEALDITCWIGRRLDERQMRPLMKEFKVNRTAEGPTDYFVRLASELLSMIDHSAVLASTFPEVCGDKRRERLVEALWYHAVPALVDRPNLCVRERIRSYLTDYWFAYNCGEEAPSTKETPQRELVAAV